MVRGNSSNRSDILDLDLEQGSGLSSLLRWSESQQNDGQTDNISTVLNDQHVPNDHDYSTPRPPNDNDRGNTDKIASSKVSYVSPMWSFQRISSHTRIYRDYPNQRFKVRRSGIWNPGPAMTSS